MEKEIAVVIPALAQNTYAPEGDLMRFGDLTLLEWKIIQIIEFLPADHIYVSTPSDKIRAIAKRYGCKVLLRSQAVVAYPELVSETAQQVSEPHLMWVNATAPFIGKTDYVAMINQYQSMDRKHYDSLITVQKINEYVLFERKPLNFTFATATSRREIKPVYKMTSGGSIVPTKMALARRNFYGEAPFMFEVERLASMEITTHEDRAIADQLLALYLRQQGPENRK